MATKELYCPIHAEKLVLRVAKQGKHPGKKFWGCPTWSKTKCSYTIPFEKSESVKREKKDQRLKWLRNKKGNISIIKILKNIIMIPLYIIGFGIKMLDKVYSNNRQSRY